MPWTLSNVTAVLLQATLRFTHLVLPAFAQLPLAAQRAWSVDFVEAFTAAPAGVWACSLLVSSSSWAQALQLNDHASGPFLLVRPRLPQSPPVPASFVIVSWSA